MSCVTLWDEDSWKLLLGFLQSLPCADFALHPCTVPGLSCECGSLWAAGNPNKSPKPGCLSLLAGGQTRSLHLVCAAPMREGPSTPPHGPTAAAPGVTFQPGTAGLTIMGRDVTVWFKPLLFLVSDTKAKPIS